jgi:hypothetical protein
LISLGNGTDFVYAGAGDTINIGKGSDTVAFGIVPRTTIIGNENVNGFLADRDVVLFNSALFVNFAAVMGAAKQIGPDTLITHDAGNTVDLHNVTLTSLSTNNFQFG